jgi:hypothetical protein
MLILCHLTISQGIGKLSNVRVTSKSDSHEYRDVGSAANPEEVVDESSLRRSHHQASVEKQQHELHTPWKIIKKTSRGHVGRRTDKSGIGIPSRKLSF